MPPPKLYFRCVNFRVEAALVPLEAVSNIEEHVLRAVAAGFATLTDVRGLLGLPLRTSMETINGMLRRNLLVIDFRTGRFHVPQAARTAVLERSELGASMPRGGQQYSQTEAFSLCLNRTTGTLTGRRRLRWLSFAKLGEPPAEIVFPVPETVEVGDLNAVAITARIDAIVRSRGLLVRDVDLAGATPYQEGGLIAHVFAAEWGDGEDDASVALQFEADQRVNARETAELEMSVLATRQHSPWFWSQLGARRVASGHGLPTRSLRCLPDSPAGLAGDLARQPETTLDARAVERHLAHLLQMLGRAERVSLELGAPSVVAAVRRVVAARERQAVLVCPFLEERHATALLTTPRIAGTADAPVGVAWGIDASPTEDSANTVAALGEIPDVSLDPAQGSSTHAKVAVQDARRAVVATKNFLSSGENSHLFDVAIVAEGGPLTTEILEWASALVPAAPELRWTAAQLPGPPPTGGGFPLPPPQGIPTDLDALAQAIDALLPDTGTIEGVRSLVAGLRNWWREALQTMPDEVKDNAASRDAVVGIAQTIARRLDESGWAVCELVRTSDHRPMMFDALERAEHWVVVCSHRLGRRPLGPNWQQALTDALDRGVDVVLLWGEESDDVDGHTRLLDQLTEVAQDRLGTLTINRMPLQLHCKLLLVDGLSTIITSFEFLHFLNSQEYTRHELGVWVGSPRVTGRLLAGLTAHVEASGSEVASALAALDGRMQQQSASGEDAALR